jgi:hypothetical protein
MGKLYNDIWNTTLSLVPPADAITSMGPVSQVTCDDVATIVSNWWNGTSGYNSPMISVAATLTGIKLNRINTAGHYQDDPTIQHIYTTASPGSVGNYVPPQLTMAHTLVTDITRGRGSRGRMFMPPGGDLGNVTGAGGGITNAQALAYATSTASLITHLNTYGLAVFRVGVASKVGSGAFHPVTAVKVGSIIDTMRSRRNKDVEVYSSHTV